MTNELERTYRKITFRARQIANLHSVSKLGVIVFPAVQWISTFGGGLPDIFSG
jgi:hypothetical protein